MVRVEKVVAPLKIPVDLLVVSAERFEYWRETPNTVIHKVADEGWKRSPRSTSDMDVWQRVSGIQTA